MALKPNETIGFDPDHFEDQKVISIVADGRRSTSVSGRDGAGQREGLLTNRGRDGRRTVANSRRRREPPVCEGDGARSL